jgi:hypothetical protein
MKSGVTASQQDPGRPEQRAVFCEVVPKSPPPRASTLEVHLAPDEIRRGRQLATVGIGNRREPADSRPGLSRKRVFSLRSTRQPQCWPAADLPVCDTDHEEADDRTEGERDSLESFHLPHPLPPIGWEARLGLPWFAWTRPAVRSPHFIFGSRCEQGH